MKNKLSFVKQFKKPIDIQIFLNGLLYNSEYVTNSPKNVFLKQKANCFEGALFTAAVLRTMGHKPLIVDLVAENDDDHVIAIYKQNNCFGAVAKSNTTLLQFREPVYRSLRELIMSYFDFYFNTLGEKSLRTYSNPVNLSRFDKYNWMTTNDDLEFIGDYLYTIRHNKIVSPNSLRSLSRADDDLIKLCFSGSIEEGLFKPKRK